MLSGLLVRCIPYRYLYGVSLLAHVVGYTVSAITYEDWLVVISMFLTGFFTGIGITLTFSYATESSVEYVELMRKRKETVEEGTVQRVKSYLFSLQSIGLLFGNLLGTGKWLCTHYCISCNLNTSFTLIRYCSHLCTVSNK